MFAFEDVEFKLVDEELVVVRRNSGGGLNPMLVAASMADAEWKATLPLADFEGAKLEDAFRSRANRSTTGSRDCRRL